MVIPNRIAQLVLSGKAQNRAEMAVYQFGPEDNKCVVMIMNLGALNEQADWYMKAAMAFKAEGKQDEADIIKKFFEQLVKAVTDAPGIS